MDGPIQKGERIESFLDWLREQILTVGAEQLSTDALFDERESSLNSLIREKLGKSFGIIVALSLPRVTIESSRYQQCRLTCLVSVMSNVAMASQEQVSSFTLARTLFCGLHGSRFMARPLDDGDVFCNNLAHTRTDADMLHTFEVSTTTAFC